MIRRLPCLAGLVLLLGIRLSAQGPAVLLAPLQDGPQAELAHELNLILQKELTKSGVALSFAGENPPGAAALSKLLDQARSGRLVMVLVQSAPSGNSIRHELFATRDGRPLSSIVVEGLSKATLNRRAGQIAREIAAWVKDLPADAWDFPEPSAAAPAQASPATDPETSPEPAPGPVASPLPVDAEAPAAPANPQPAISLGLTLGGALGETAAYFGALSSSHASIAWSLPPPVDWLGLGLAFRHWSATAQGSGASLGLMAEQLGLLADARWRFAESLDWYGRLNLSAALLTIFPPDQTWKAKLLPGGAAETGLSLGLGSQIDLEAGVECQALLDPGFPMVILAGKVGLRCRL